MMLLHVLNLLPVEYTLSLLIADDEQSDGGGGSHKKKLEQ